MNHKRVLLAAGLLAFAGAAQATDLNYNFIEAGYGVVDFDDFDEDLKAVTIGGSFLLAEEIYVFGGYVDGKTDDFTMFGDRGRLGVTGYTLGLGYRYGVNRQTDFNFEAAFERSRLEGRGGLSWLGSDSENGYSLAVGLRHLVAPAFELGADVTYVDIGDEDDTVLGLSALWHVAPTVAVGLAYGIGSDAKSYAGGIRLKF